MNYDKPKSLKFVASEFVNRDSLSFQVGQSMFLLQNDTQPEGPVFYTLSSRDDGEFGEFKEVLPGVLHFIDQRCLNGEPPGVLLMLPRGGTAAYTDHWAYTTVDQDGEDCDTDIDLPMVLFPQIVACAHAAAIEIALVGPKEFA